MVTLGFLKDSYVTSYSGNAASGRARRHRRLHEQEGQQSDANVDSKQPDKVLFDEPWTQ